MIALETKLPKNLNKEKQNSELALAIALTRRKEWSQAEIYITRAIQNIERVLHLNKSVPVEQNTCTDPKNQHNFNLQMQSLCLAYHQLGTIKYQIKKYSQAQELYSKAYALASKYIEDFELKRIIKQDLNSSTRASKSLVSSTLTSSAVSPKFSGTKSRNSQVIDTYSDKELVAELLGPKKKKKKKPRVKLPSAKNLYKTDDFFSLLKLEARTPTTSLPVLNSAVSEDSKKSQELSKFRQLEQDSAVKIQKVYRGWVTRVKLKQEEKQEFVLEESPIELTPARNSEDSKELPMKSLLKKTRKSIKKEKPTQNQTEKSQFWTSIQEKTQLVIRKRAEIPSYLNLTRPEISLTKPLQKVNYDWKLKISSVETSDSTIYFSLDLIGTGTNLTSNLFYTFPVEFKPANYQDYRVMAPFEFETLWPVLEPSVKKLVKEEPSAIPQNNSSSIMDSWNPSRSYDESATERVKSVFERLLDEASVDRTPTGHKLSFDKPLEENQENSELDLEVNHYLHSKEGTFKNFLLHLEHESQNSENYQIEESGVDGVILEQGLVKLEGQFMHLVIFGSTRITGELLTSYKSCLELELRTLNSKWQDSTLVTWEAMLGFFNDLEFELYISHLISKKRFPQKAKDLLYKRLPSFLAIRDSKVVFQPPKPCESPQLESFSIPNQELFQGSYAQAIPQSSSVECFAKKEVNFSVPSNNELLLFLDKLQLEGAKEHLHFKLTYLFPGKILATAVTCIYGHKLLYTISDAEKVQGILSASEESEEAVKSLVKSFLQVKESLVGKVLCEKGFEFKHQAVRKIQLKRFIVSIGYRRDTWSLFLYSASEGKVLSVDFKDSDLSSFFPKLQKDECTAVEFEKTFFNPLVDKLCFYRNHLGLVIVWETQKETQEPKLSELGHIKPFKLSEVKNTKGCSMLKPKTALENNIAQILKQDSKCLMLSKNQEEVVLQRAKLVLGHLCIVTVSKLSFLEEWRIYLHFSKLCRTFVCKFYDSDIFNLSEKALSVEYSDPEHVVNMASEHKKAWEIILNESYFENADSELLFYFDNIKCVMKEVVYSQQVEHEYDLVYFEVLFKSPFSQSLSPIRSMQETKNYTLIFKAFYFDKRIWVKKALKLNECILMLIKEGYLEESILVNTCIKYSDLRLYSGLLCRLVKMKTKHHTISQKLLPEITEECRTEVFETQNQQAKRNHSINSIYEKDELLYETVYSTSPVTLVSVHHNTLVEEFLVKVYLKEEGTMLRQPFSEKTIFREVAFSESLLQERLYKTLGKRILLKYASKVVENLHPKLII